VSHRARLERYATVSTALALVSDRRLGELVDAAPTLGAGIGGSRALLTIEGLPVFVKRVSLTDLEARPEHVRSTENMFGMPPFGHYGVDSAGFGVWRELAVHEMTTNWVLADECGQFPMMYHWRVLPGTVPVPVEYADLERAVALWGGSEAVRRRLESLVGATMSVVLFLEYLPQTMPEWLTAQVAAGDAALDAAVVFAERELRSAASFMGTHGLLHFDAHFGNVLTDGQQVYLTDFGLAASTRFDLCDAERAFLGTNASYDGCLLLGQLVNGLVGRLAGVSTWQERFAFIRRCAETGEVPRMPPAAASVVTRYAPVSAVINEFFRALHEDRATPYPVDEIARLTATS